MFAGAKLGAPLAAGNVIVIKPPDQAPLSTLRLAAVCLNMVAFASIRNWTATSPNLFRAESAKWSKVIREAGIKAN